MEVCGIKLSFCNCHLKPWFLSPGTLDVWGQVIVYGGGFPVHCRMLSSVPSFCCLPARYIYTPQLWPPKMCPDIARGPLASKIITWLKTSSLRMLIGTTVNQTKCQGLFKDCRLIFFFFPFLRGYDN